MLSLKDVALTITADEKEVPILKGINLDLEKGKMYAITGPNGSGKSSVARVIMGIYKTTGGTITYEGEDISKKTITERAKMGFGYAFQHPARFKGMTVADMLEIAMRLRDKITFNCSYLNSIGLCPNEYMHRYIDNNLSGGEIKRIEIATLLALQPEVRIFDEPEAGIDLWSFARLIDVIGSSHKKDDITVIISHQEKILKMVDEIILIENGVVAMKGDKDTVWPQIKDRSSCECRGNCEKEGAAHAECS